MALVVDHARRHPNVTPRHVGIGGMLTCGRATRRVALVARPGEHAVGQVVLERAAVRREDREVGRVEVQLVHVGHDDPVVAERLVGVHGPLDPLGQRDRLQPRPEATGGSFEDALEEGFDSRQDAHAADRTCGPTATPPAQSPASVATGYQRRSLGYQRPL